MIRIDIHEDERLLKEFRPFDTLVEPVALPFGDFCFPGNGPDNEPVMVGIERKTIRDLVTSIRSKRLAGHQLGGMLDAYPHAAYLLVEGIWQPGRGGEVVIRGGKEWVPLTTGSQPISYREVDHFLATMEESGLRVHRTANMGETAAYIVSRYKWWNDKPYESHKAHMSIYAPAPEKTNHTGRRLGFRRPEQPNLVVRMAAQIEGIEGKAWKVGEYFKSPWEMITGTEDNWRQALGFKKGEATVKKIIRELVG